MFKSLKEKLNLFKKKAKEEITSEEDETPRKEKTTSGSQSKFLKKVKSRSKDKKGKKKKSGKKNKEKKVDGKGSLDQDRGSRSETKDRSEISLTRSLEDSGLRGDTLLRGEGSLMEGSNSRGLFARKISEKRLDDVLMELEMALLESDVAQPVVERIKEYVTEELTGAKVNRKTDLDELIEGALRNAIGRVLSSRDFSFDDFLKRTKKPIVIMFVGVNGTGKTTAIARVAHLLKKKQMSVVLAAGDTFRAGAIEQLTKHAENLGLKIIKHKAEADPAAVAYDAVEHARARKKDVILLDTAGRMQTNINLMDEMKKIRRVADPDLIVFVGDSLAGNDAVIQAQKFDEAVGVDGVILTKIDADAKGGAALSIAYTIGKPIIFIGTGQDYEDLIPFDPEWMTERLFEE